MGDKFDEFMEKLCGVLNKAWMIDERKWNEVINTLKKNDRKIPQKPMDIGELLSNPIYLHKCRNGRGIMENYFAKAVFTIQNLATWNLCKEYQYENSCPDIIREFISPIKKSESQKMDWCFYKIVPYVFFELESMDRAQIYLFADPLKNGAYWTKENDNKLWYYYWSLAKLYLGQREEVPRYFVFFLCLPDARLPNGYKNAAGNDYHWDNHYYHWDFYQSPQLGINPQTINPANSVYPSPFQFYWPKIKQLCADFLSYHLKTCNCSTLTGNWSAEDLEKFLRNGCSKCNSSPRLKKLQEDCELILIAYNCNKQLIVSRGKDLFDCTKDQVWSIETGKPERVDARENPQKL